MQSIKDLYQQAGRHPIKSAIVITLLAAVILFLVNKSATTVPESTDFKPLPVVAVSTSQAFAGETAVSLIGNVRAFTQAAVTAERSGRVTQVRATLGQKVAAGQILATLENAAESAAVLQAEGAYDAAVAARAKAVAAQQQTVVGVGESQNAIKDAQNNAINTYRSAYTTVNGTIFNSIDEFFTKPEGMLPGLRISGGDSDYFNSERITYQQILPQWQKSSTAISLESDLPTALNSAEANVDRTLAFVDAFIALLNQRDSNGTRYTEAELQTYSTNFNAARAQLVTTKNTIAAARVQLKNAEDASTRADISVSVSDIPTVDAQIKQALGTLRSAQATYAETVLRTPISGTVNDISIKAGDFVSVAQAVAEVANNNALEIVTYVSDKERDVLAVGDTVLIENAYEGRVSQIAPAIDNATKKTEVRITTENTNIKNGDTVTISKALTTTTTTDTAVVIPLTAVKFEIEDGFVFTVVDGTLVQNPVKLGTIRSNSVTILEGLSATDAFVVDARGLLAGTEVAIKE